MRIFCSICKDIFIPYSEVHVTNCGHLYHGTCISTWVKQHRTCPQCRAKTSQPFRVYFDVEKDTDKDTNTLEHEVEVLSDKLSNVEREKKCLLEDYNNVTSILDNMKEYTLSLSTKNDVLRTSVTALKMQVSNLTKKKESIARLESEVEIWKNKVSTLERIETIVKGSYEDANKMIESTPVTELAVRQLCTYVAALKTQLLKVEGRNNKLIKENKDLNKTLQKKESEDSSSEAIKNLKEANSRLENELSSLKALHMDYKKKHQKKLAGRLSTAHDISAKENVKRSFFDMDLDLDDLTDKSPQSVDQSKVDKSISHWEDLVCAGYSKNATLFLKKNRLFSKSIPTNLDNNEVSSSSLYEFDGFGGRKKVRLGCPTPIDEFKKIKKNKKSTQLFRTKK